MPDKQAFLSSTGRDLTEYRKAAYKAIEGLDGWHCVWMEDFGARDWDADEFCRAKVAECDVLVGVIGHLYGTIPEGKEHSYTEQEYEAAVEANKPRLMFLAPEGFPLPADLIEPDEKREKQRAFRQRVNRERIRDTFASPEDLAWRVVAAIRNWEQEDAAEARRPAAARGKGIMPLPPQPYFPHVYPLEENFTGRASQRQLLTEWLATGDHPMLVLEAIGGMGKSALSWAWLQRDVLGLPLPGLQAEAAEPCRVPDAARPEGVMWWSFYERAGAFATFLDKALTYVSGGEVDPAAIPSTYEKVEALVNLLQQRRILLVLDGFERQMRGYERLSAAYQGDSVAGDAGGTDHLACTEPHAADFLRRVASLPLQGRVLLTSRLFPRELEGLAGCRREKLPGLEPEDAVAFFHAQGVEGARHEIEAACEPYGYLPLALRLLAGLIVRDKQSPGDIRAAERYPVVRELVGKEQHHILEVSYEALDGRKRALLSRIAAFRSPMSYEAVSILNTYRGEKSFHTALDELVDRGLLQYGRATERYDLHPIVRWHAYVRLRDKKGVHRRLRDYFANVPAPEEDEVQSVEDLAPVMELYHHTVGAGQYDEAQELYRDQLVRPLHHRFGAYETCIELLRGLFPDGEDRPPRLKEESAQGWTLNTLAGSYAFTGQPRRALPLAGVSGAMAERRGDQMNLATGLENLATLQIALGELGAAEENLRRDIELAEQIGNRYYQATGHEHLGRLLAYSARFAESHQHLTSAREVFDEMGAGRTNSVSVIRAYCALRALLMGDGESGLAAARDARRLADEVAKRGISTERDFIRAEWLTGCGLVALAARKPGEREEMLREAGERLADALRRCRRISMVDHEADIVLAWARWHRVSSNPERAWEHAEEALAIADRCEYRLAQADAHNFLSRVALDEGDPKAAREHAEIAKERAWCDGPPHCYKPALEEAERLLEEAGAGA